MKTISSPHPLDDVLTRTLGGSILEFHTGLFNLGRNRALQSGTTVPLPEDIRSLEDHARAMAQDTYRDRYDPAQNPHDAMHKAEYERNLSQREDAEKTEQHASANLRDAEANLARAPKVGSKPMSPPMLVVAFIIVITLTVAPTLHDSVFQTLADDLLSWFGAWLNKLQATGQQVSERVAGCGTVIPTYPPNVQFFLTSFNRRLRRARRFT